MNNGCVFLNMRKITVSVLFIACMFTLSACSSATTKGEILLKEGTIEKVSVTSLPEGYDYSFSGKAAQSVNDYISELNLASDYSENPNEYDGMTWVISLEYGDGNVLTIYHFGNMFIRTTDSSWYKMTYEEASRFDSLLYELTN